MLAKTITLSNGIIMPTMGIGTWQMGEHAAQKKQEIKALSYAIDLGFSLIDTAEMYGRAEEVVGEAIRSKRQDLFLVSKVLPHHADFDGTIKACDRSLKALKTDYIDLYLLHWVSSYPLEETLRAFQKLKRDSKIRAYGISNFDTKETQRAYQLDKHICVNQVLYSLFSRGVEYDLWPFMKQKNIALMAYSPLYQTKGLDHPQLVQLAQEQGCTSAQLVLAWLLHQGVIPIPKSSNKERIKENFLAWSLSLSPTIQQQLETLYPAPKRKVPLDII